MKKKELQRRKGKIDIQWKLFIVYNINRKMENGEAFLMNAKDFLLYICNCSVFLSKIETCCL